MIRIKISFLISIVLLACFEVIAQERPLCPIITVDGPRDLTQPGEVMVFSVTADPPLPNSAKFEWTVSDGVIESGQGTNSIRVQVPRENPPTVIKASVRISSASCMVMSYEAAGVRPLPDIEPYDFYGKATLNEEKARLQNAAYTLEQDPGYKLFIFKRFPHIGAPERRRINDITRWIIVNLKVPREKFQIITSYRPQVETMIIIASPNFDAEKLK